MILGRRRRLRTFFRDDVSEDPRRCRVCGHYTKSSRTLVLIVLLAVVSATLVQYIVADVIENGRLDGSLSIASIFKWCR